MPVLADERMSQMNIPRIAGLMVVGMAVALLGGCRVEKTDNGDGKDVKIATPFGGMHVKTNGSDVLGSIGLPAYPGAQPSNDTGNDNRSADVDMNFGGFQLRVKKADFRTNDSPDKVEAFYRTGLRRFGDVVACRDRRAVGTPERTVEGLGCDEKHNSGFSNYDGGSALQLKAGSEQHQHVVEIEKDGDGTKIGLVALDLPGKNGDGPDRQ